MIIIICSIIMFSLGFAGGLWLRALIYDNQPWEMFRWDSTSLGYRPIPLGSMLGRADNVIMALRLNMLGLPIEGIPYDADGPK
jgi:hypothetical protein